MLPICAICDKPIDKLTEGYHPVERIRAYTAECHGDIEVVNVGDKELMDFCGAIIRPGQAFMTRKITVGK